MMRKRLLSGAMVTLMALPVWAQASSLEDLTDRLEELEEQIADKEEGWDLAARLQFSGDIRNRFDYHQASTPEYWNGREAARAMRRFGMVTEETTPAQMRAAFAQFIKMSENLAASSGGTLTAQQARSQLMNSVGSTAKPAADYSNDSIYTTRLRLNMRVKATENVEVKARLVGYKAWGLQSAPFGDESDPDGVYSPYFLTSRSFDGTVGRQATDSALLVDRAFMNWNNIAGLPIWFSVGRRPTTDGPPAHLRTGMDQRMATPINYMDYPFDGISMGYAYASPFGLEGAGRVRFCYGRGYEAGSQIKDSGMRDVDFAGFDWDVYKNGHRFINLQAFGAFNIFNVPGDTNYPNPIEVESSKDPYRHDGLGGTTTNPYYGSTDTNLDRTNLGNIFHTSIIFMDKIEAASLHWFVVGGWSHSQAKGIDELGTTLLGSWGNEPEDKDGYGFYAGLRYDLDELGLRLGAEFNYGSKNWLAFTPGHDDMYTSKLYTRGKAYELYTIWDIPGGEPISKFGRAFMRLGYQHIDYDYTYSGMWLGEPTPIDELSDAANAMFYAQFDKVDQLYLTIEATF